MVIANPSCDVTKIAINTTKNIQDSMFSFLLEISQLQTIVTSFAFNKSNTYSTMENQRFLCYSCWTPCLIHDLCGFIGFLFIL